MPSVRASGAITVERGAKKAVKATSALREAGPDRGCWTWRGTSQSPQTSGAVARHQVPAPGTMPATAAGQGPDTVDVSARGTAGEVVLVLYGRIPIGSLQIDGDRRILGQLSAWDPDAQDGQAGEQTRGTSTVARVTEPSYLAAIQESYDTVAADYAELVKSPAELDPLSRAMLAAFAEVVRVADRGPVADLGCGPGKVTAHLADLGVPAFGIDLSPKMIELARQAYPGLRFEVGSMTSLAIRDNDLGGILAYYSTHHTPPESLPRVFAEFHRTLAPGGHLMLAGHVGDDVHLHLRPTQAYGGHPVSYESHLLPADRIVALLEQAGLALTARLSEEPAEGAKRAIATFLARKPEQP